MLQTIYNRTKEPSTHAGLSLMLLAAAAFMPQYAFWINSMAGLFGFTAAAIPEKGEQTGF